MTWWDNAVIIAAIILGPIAVFLLWACLYILIMSADG